MSPARHVVFAIGLAAPATLATADINAGVTVSTTGPAASLGILDQRAVVMVGIGDSGRH